MWILTYLQERADRVIDFFESLYFYAKTFLPNFIQWVKNIATGVVQWIRVELIGFVIQQITIVGRAIGSVLQSALNVIDSVKAYLLGKYFELRAVINVTLAVWAERINRVWQDARSYALALFNTARASIATIANWLSNALGTLSASIGQNARNIAQLGALVNSFNPARIVWLVNAAFPFLLRFVTNPFEIISAFWRAYLLQFLEWALAYALGSTDEPLPPIPNLFSKGIK